MPIRRENVAAALKYLQDKADLRGRFQRATSLDPQEQDLADIAVETGASFIPGVGPALAARDVERARRANDPAGMAMAAASAIPGERLAKLLGKFDPTRLELDVYHGTPHRFEPTEANPLGEFDASKIGTGEGAQAYGHGVYVAEAPDVAMGYAKGVKDMGSINAINKEMSDLAKIMSADEIPGQYRKYRSDAGKTAAKRYDELMEQRQAVVDKPGALYKADLPDEMINRMLDWDKPLSEQPAAVQKALRELAELGNEESNARWLLSKDNDPKTSALFKAIGDALPGVDRMAAYPGSAQLSAGLAKRGIPGIKYADAGSRGQGGSGTRNFVVFPGEEKKVRILERK